ncbi:MAG: trk/ktr system potassium uptake protein [Actinomycetota bacterium]|nr:trk/ktr system potassium uptake protein [Actinomycetota bacterium]
MAYLIVLAIGTVLLLLPIARSGAGGATLLQAAFTSTSVVCVTGLAVVDTATYWSGFGHVVILFLAQIGGLGVMTLTSLITLRLANRLGLRQRLSTSEETHALGPGSVRQVVRAVVVSALIVESILTAVMALRLWLHYDEPLLRAIWLALFQSVSAFNNLGYALYSDNLMGFVSDWWICIPICVGVIVGGLGLPVLRELWHHRHLPQQALASWWATRGVGARASRPPVHRQHTRWSIHTRMMLTGTAALLVGGFGYLLAAEWSNPGTLGPLSVPSKVLASITLSVVPRTGGFNSVNVAELRTESWFITDLLMLVGAGPGGTAGGLKITTVGVLAAIAVTEIRGNRRTRVFDRNIPSATQRTAVAVSFVFISVMLVSTALLLTWSPFPLEPVLTEVISALSTVGLSTGITAQLNPAGQILLMVLMFIGRLGPITLAAALAVNTRTTHYSLPEERPYIG